MIRLIEVHSLASVKIKALCGVFLQSCCVISFDAQRETELRKGRGKEKASYCRSILPIKLCEAKQEHQEVARKEFE